LERFPLKNPPNPSCDKILVAQSTVPEYLLLLASIPDYIINLLLIVSKGKEMVSEVVTTNCAKKNLSKKEAFF